MSISVTDVIVVLISVGLRFVSYGSLGMHAFYCDGLRYSPAIDALLNRSMPDRRLLSTFSTKFYESASDWLWELTFIQLLSSLLIGIGQSIILL
jgi:hypothetical protein